MWCGFPTCGIKKAIPEWGCLEYVPRTVKTRCIQVLEHDVNFQFTQVKIIIQTLKLYLMEIFGWVFYTCSNVEAIFLTLFAIGLYCAHNTCKSTLLANGCITAANPKYLFIIGKWIRNESTIFINILTFDTWKEKNRWFFINRNVIGFSFVEIGFQSYNWRRVLDVVFSSQYLK